MASIKSFTSLKQSKVLTGILSLESADMFYVAGKGEPIFIGHKMIAYGDDDYDALGGPDVLCWSLAALLDILPRVDIEKEICSDDTYDYRVKAYIGDGYIGDWFNNSVDACVAMIEKLHELKVL